MTSLGTSLLDTRFPDLAIKLAARLVVGSSLREISGIGKHYGLKPISLSRQKA